MFPKLIPSHQLVLVTDILDVLAGVEYTVIGVAIVAIVGTLAIVAIVGTLAIVAIF